jgi:hypothetical protein
MAVKKISLSFDDYVKGIRSLRPEEQLSLVEMISARLKKKLGKKRVKHSVLELEGLGAKIWKGIDAQKYVHNERETWD